VLLNEEWSYAPIFFVQIILVFFLIFVDFAYNKYQRFKSKYSRLQKERENEKFIADVFSGILKGQGV
jgi:hypothetical protein